MGCPCHDSRPPGWPDGRFDGSCVYDETGWLGFTSGLLCGGLPPPCVAPGAAGGLTLTLVVLVPGPRANHQIAASTMSTMTIPRMVPRLLPLSRSTTTVSCGSSYRVSRLN